MLLQKVFSLKGNVVVSPDNHTSQTVMINLATSMENLGKNVNTWIFWDGGHCADDDPGGFIGWIGSLMDLKD